MDLAKARSIHLKSKRSTRLQAKGRSVLSEKYAVRWRKVKEMASEGATFQEVIDETGLSEAGLKSLLYRETGKSTWPPKNDAS